MRSFAVVCLLAAAALGVCAQNDATTNLINEKGARQPLLLGKLFGRDPNGFSIGMGVGLGAEVDDIDASVDLGPFGFSLDPAPSRGGGGGGGGGGKNRGEKGASAPAEPACDRYCDPYTLQVCCNGPTGCIPNGETVATCGTAATTGYDYTYGRKLQEAREVLSNF